MPLIPLTVPPGMFKNGTPYSAKGRWADGNFVRWHDGSLRPIGGWQLRVTSLAVKVNTVVLDPAVETIRDAIKWRDNAGILIDLLFSNIKVYSLQTDGTVTDVTPAGFTGGSNQPSVAIGYNTGPYNRGAYNTPRTRSNSTQVPVYRWSRSLWGEDTLACPAAPTTGGLLYSYDASTNAQMVVVPNAPTDISGVLVTDQRIVMTIGTNAEPRLVQWSSREDREDWIPTQNNEAGFFNLQGNGKLLSITSVLDQILILSESDAWAATFIGAPFIYGFDRVGDNCGPVSPAAVVVTERFAIWPGRRSFFYFDGTVKTVACDVMDFVSEAFSSTNVSKMVGVNIARFNEIWWFYQSTGGTEIDSYVTFDYQDKHWTVGKLSRTAAYGGEGLQGINMVDALGEVYDHELAGVNVEGAYAETGPLELGQGDKNMAVRYVYPDTQNRGDVTFTLFARQMPTADERSYGPYSYLNPTPVRVLGREIRVRVDGQTAKWEVGSGTRLDVAPTGTGRR